MGIHISVYDRKSNQHPDWDCMRYAGDRDFPNVLHTVPLIKAPGDNDLLRPQSIDQLREAIRDNAMEYPERFMKLADILEANPDFWIYLGY